MNDAVQQTTVRASDKSVEKTVPHTSLLRRLLAGLSTRRLQRMHEERDQWLERGHQQYNQQLAWRVEDILGRSGLSQAAYSIAAGRSFHTPKVVSVASGPPVVLTIKLLPGQTPDDVAARTPAIAFHLGMAGVRVTPLPPSLVQLELLPDRLELCVGDRLAALHARQPAD